jgi:putative ABC transport system permease protein
MVSNPPPSGEMEGAFMFTNYLKIAWRNIKKNKLFSFINILGLSLGIATCFVIMLYVQDELSYDRFNKKC